MRSSRPPRCAVLALAVAAVLAAAAPLAAATDGFYTGTVDGRPFSLVVAGNKITSWSAGFVCPQFTGDVGVTNANCNIAANNTFSCGSLGCQTGVPRSTIAGSFSGTAVAGFFELDYDPSTTLACCSLRSLAFAATRSGSGNVPAAPTGLVATAIDDETIRLTWNDNSNNEDSFAVEGKEATGPFVELSDTVPPNTTAVNVINLNPASFYTFRVRAKNAAGFSAYSNQASATTFGVPGPCIPTSNVLCLNNDRFEVSASFETGEQSGAAQVIELTADTGYLWFFSSTNVEAVIKVLDACGFNNRYWVFAGGLTNVRTIIRVTDSQTGAVRTYINPLNTPFQPIQDTSAFATCP